MSMLKGPCWVRYNDGHVAWLQDGWEGLSTDCERLPVMDLSGLLVKPPTFPTGEIAWKDTYLAKPVLWTREEYEQKVWDLYRVTDHAAPCRVHRLGGPDDFAAALGSDIIIHEGDGTEDDPPIYLGEHVLHTVTTFAAGLPFKRPA